MARNVRGGGVSVRPIRRYSRSRSGADLSRARDAGGARRCAESRPSAKCRHWVKIWDRRCKCRAAQPDDQTREQSAGRPARRTARPTRNACGGLRAPERGSRDGPAAATATGKRECAHDPLMERSIRLMVSIGLALLAGCDLAPVYDPPHFVVPDSYQGSGPFQVANPDERSSITRGLVDPLWRSGSWISSRSNWRVRIRPCRLPRTPTHRHGPRRRSAVGSLSADCAASAASSYNKESVNRLFATRPAVQAGLQSDRRGGILGAGFLVCASQHRPRAEAPGPGKRRGFRQGALESTGGTSQRLRRGTRLGCGTRGVAADNRGLSGKQSKSRGFARRGRSPRDWISRAV